MQFNNNWEDHRVSMILSALSLIPHFGEGVEYFTLQGFRGFPIAAAAGKATLTGKQMHKMH